MRKFIESLSPTSEAGALTDIINRIYQIILALLAAVIVTAVITYYFEKEAAAGFVGNYFAESVKQYKSLAENDVDSLIVGLISPAVSQIGYDWKTFHVMCILPLLFQLNCCGMQNASDFVNMSPWDQYHSHNFTGKLRIPLLRNYMKNSTSDRLI
ncbi:hypothetical protein FBUS_08148 [Fasciolopsis buskii]|uniref:Uncharacterized protein n=1 Tax=Fasciolopsis buskii TaxID=27845 RepID=A0A8E0RQ44_9TREM|nr:hypothetical protein FBUS_08148 [Fasciolopsis buski]